MLKAAAAWDLLLIACDPAFTQPSLDLFHELLTAWVLCPARRTVTGMLRICGLPLRRAHDAYHRLLREGAWQMALIWEIAARRLVASLILSAEIPLALDDTLFHKTGRSIEGAGIFRDAVRSSGSRVVHALGLNLVVLTVRVKPPWRGEPLGLPINLRLYRKGGKTLIDLAEDMAREVAGWFPDRRFRLCCDGFYAPLAGRALPRTHVISRMRRDAALFTSPPQRTRGQRPFLTGLSSKNLRATSSLLTELDSR